MTFKVEPLWTWREVGEFLGLKRSAVKALIASTDIPCVWLTGSSHAQHFEPQAVRDWVLAKRTPGGADLTRRQRHSRKVA